MRRCRGADYQSAILEANLLLSNGQMTGIDSYFLFLYTIVNMILKGSASIAIKKNITLMFGMAG
jgi:hypothetical protein